MQVVSFLGETGFLYEQSTGCFYLADSQDGNSLIARGYSGQGGSRNEPSHEDRQARGPIPRGLWRIHPAIRHTRLGRVSIPLTPKVDETALGRSGFYIHGDNAERNGSASTGCIILPYDVRLFIEGSGFGTLTVVDRLGV